MERADRRPGLPPELVVAALVAAAALPLVGRIYRAGRGGSVVVITAAAVVGLAWVLRRMRVPLPVAGVVSGAAFLWFASALFFPGEMAGPLPTPSSISKVIDALSSGADLARTERSPVRPIIPMLMLLSSAVWATGWLVHDAAVHLRRPLLAIGLSLPLLVIPSIAAPRLHRLSDLWPFLGAALLLLLVDERLRLRRWGAAPPGTRPAVGLGPAAAVTAGTVAIALALTPLIPGLNQPVRRPSTRVAYNPIISIRPQLLRQPTAELFRVSTDHAAYYRLTSLDTFDGIFWTKSEEPASLALGERRAAPTSDTRVRRLIQSFEIVALGGPWMPAAYEPVLVAGAGGVQAQPSTRALLFSTDLSRGTAYTVESAVPAPSRAELERFRGRAGRRLRPYLELPRLPREVGRIARGIVRGERTAFGRALALQSWLREFTYDEDVAAGHRIDDIVQFLEVRRGYCEQFAGTMAVMARLIGLPSRVSVGFTPGDRIGADAYRITTRHAHSWTEIFFEGIGWVAFEPTPRSGYVTPPAYAAPARPEEPREQERAPATPTPTVTPAETPAGGETPRPREETAPRRGGSWVVPVLAAIVGVLATAAYPLAAAARRRRRRRAAGSPRDAVAVRYVEFLEWCTAAGIGRRIAETPAEHAARLARLSVSVAPAADFLARAAGEALWSALEPEYGFDVAQTERAVADARRALEANVSRWRRVGASVRAGR